MATDVSSKPESRQVLMAAVVAAAATVLVALIGRAPDATPGSPAHPPTIAVTYWADGPDGPGWAYDFAGTSANVPSDLDIFVIAVDIDSASWPWWPHPSYSPARSSRCLISPPADRRSDGRWRVRWETPVRLPGTRWMAAFGAPEGAG